MAQTSKSQLALITGASSGIGLELAKVFASEGHDLVLVSDNRSKLETARAEIQHAGPAVRIELVEADLSRPDGPEQAYAGAKRTGRPVDILVNNAGVGVWGEFPGTDLAAELKMIQINVASVVALTKLVSRDMVERGSGKILITASEASLAPTALLTVYGATKAFDYSFAQALREELKDKGVTVTALMPGATATNFFNRAGAGHTKIANGKLADPKQIARDGYDALMSGDDHVVTPLKDKLKITTAKFMPDKMVVQRIE
jgi:uncharacterized protein